MELFTPSYFLPCLYAFVGCVAFAVTFNIHGREIPISALGGAVGWLVYLLAAPWIPGEIVRYFLASLALSVYCEVMARLRKCPATSYLLISIFPLVPGRRHLLHHGARHPRRDRPFHQPRHAHPGPAGALAPGHPAGVLGNADVDRVPPPHPLFFPFPEVMICPATTIFSLMPTIPSSTLTWPSVKPSAGPGGARLPL